MQSITVAVLAKELGVKINDVLHLAHDLGIHVARGAAQLHQKQADKIRELHAYGQRPSRAVATRRVEPVRQPQSPPLAPTSTTHTPSSELEWRGHLKPDRWCACCGLALPDSWVSAVTTQDAQYCGICPTHLPVQGESPERAAARQADHNSRLLTAYQNIWSDHVKERDGKAAALRGRSAWRTALVELVLNHEQSPSGGCGFCGGRDFPCRTLSALERVNKGIARQIEELGTLSDDDLAEWLKTA